MAIFTRKEKEVVSILSIGTFLEYFDFYLYLHFASVLNKLFFAVSDEFSSYLLTSFAYCSSYVFRPIGALIFGHIGDTYGRKYVIRITLFMMGLSCLGIFMLPTYDDIGVWASVMITLFRAMQGVSTMGEVVGGEIYLSEYLKGRNVFVGLAIIITMCNLACIIALFGIKLALNDYFSFRYLFLFGISIFVLGYFARRNLVESPDFIKSMLARPHVENISVKTWFYSLFLNAIVPVGLFIAIIGIHNIYREVYNYTDSMIIGVSLMGVISCTCYSILAIFMGLIFNPYRLALIRSTLAVILLLIMPFCLTYYPSLIMTMVLHCLVCVLMCGEFHVSALMYRNVPTLKRFKFSAINFSLSRALIAIISGFGLVVMQPYLGNYTYSVFGLPFLIGYLFAIKHFRDLDMKNPNGLLQHYNN